MQINIELNTFWSDLPFWQVLVMGTARRLQPSWVSLLCMEWFDSPFLPLQFLQGPADSLMVPAEDVQINVWSTSQLWEVRFSFPWPGFSSAAKAGSFVGTGSWRWRKGFPLSWLWFRVPEGLLLLPGICSPHWADLGSWASSELLDSQGFLMGEHLGLASHGHRQTLELAEAHSWHWEEETKWHLSLLGGSSSLDWPHWSMKLHPRGQVRSVHVRSLTLKYDLILSQCSGVEKGKTVEFPMLPFSTPQFWWPLLTLSVFPFPDGVRNRYTFWINFLLAVPVDEDCFYWFAIKHQTEINVISE